MLNYFCGWYFRCQSDWQTLAVIPSVHRTKKSKFCAMVASYSLTMPP